MDLLPTQEQQEITAAAAALLAKQARTDLHDPRRSLSPPDPLRWGQYADLGWFGLGLPEARGGVGYGMAEEALLYREIGRYLAPGPFLASTLGARVASAAGASELASAILSGGATVGLAEPSGHDAQVGDRLTGTFDLFDADGATHLLVVTPESAVLVAAEDVGTSEVVRCIDPAVHFARVRMEALVPVVAVPAATDLVFQRGVVLAGAVLAGIGEATRDEASEWAKTREQFGRPIGVNQAIKHRCADMAVRAELSTQQVLFAALAIDERRSDLAFQAAAAKVVATDTAIGNAAANIQVHGGIGYTFEHDAHLYLKRAHVLDRLLGDRRTHLCSLVEMGAAQ